MSTLKSSPNSSQKSTMIIKSGYVFDPLNEINGEVKDIFIKGGRVVADLSAAEAREAVVIDASGKTVMPGGVDSHAHLAGP
jgi:formylmethanofuran dehydrogenase subunit A